MDIGIGGLDPATIVGFGGTVCGIGWALFRGRVAMLLTQCAAGVLFSIHWAMVGAPTAFALTVMASIQAAAAIPLGERPFFRYVYIATLPVIAALLVFTWAGTPSVLASLGTVAVSLGRYQTRPVPFRLVLLAATPFWFMHNFLVGSLPGMTADVIGGTVNAVTTWRTIQASRRAVVEPIPEPG